MKNNIFENAKFGDKFRTRDGRKALYVSQNPYANESYVLIEGYKSAELMQNDGHFWATEGREYKDDIVSRWEEPIDEEKLDKLADEFLVGDDKEDVELLRDEHPKALTFGDIFDANKMCFKAGYRKAKRE